MADKFDIRIATAQLLRSLLNTRKTELAMYRDLRDVGLTWIMICAWCDDPTKHGGSKISAARWAKENAPIGKRWLDEHANFARRWDEFAACWKWAQEMYYTPERRPSLTAAFDLMDTKTRTDTYHSATDRSRSAVRVGPVLEGTDETTDHERIIVNPIATVLRGDVPEMTRKHVSDGSVDLVIADVPWFLRVPDERNKVDYQTERYGMTPRFRADWDKFDSIQAYEEFTEAWLTEAMRCLHRKGSLFIFCSDWCLPLIGRLLQMKDVNIVQYIQVVKLNGRPVIEARYLQYSNYPIIWVTKDGKDYRFNHHEIKQTVWLNDPFNNKRGRMKRNTWLIPTNARENKTGFPAQKGIAVYNRILTMTGLPGGTLLDLFSGSGTGTVAAMRWGMRSIGVERDPQYVADIVKRIQAEQPRTG
jgi:DNA modification methylase